MCKDKDGGGRMSWTTEYMGTDWTVGEARRQYKKGNIRCVVATREDAGRSKYRGVFYYYNIFAIDGEGKWHRIVDDGSIRELWSKVKGAWYNTVRGSDPLYEIVLAILGITVGRDEVPEIVRLYGYRYL